LRPYSAVQTSELENGRRPRREGDGVHELGRQLEGRETALAACVMTRDGDDVVALARDGRRTDMVGLKRDRRTSSGRVVWRAVRLVSAKPMQRISIGRARDEVLRTLYLRVSL
jgi:hypothetical protein